MKLEPTDPLGPIPAPAPPAQTKPAESWKPTDRPGIEQNQRGEVRTNIPEPKASAYLDFSKYHSFTIDKDEAKRLFGMDFTSESFEERSVVTTWASQDHVHNFPTTKEAVECSLKILREAWEKRLKGE